MSDQGFVVTTYSPDEGTAEIHVDSSGKAADEVHQCVCEGYVVVRVQRGGSGGNGEEVLLEISGHLTGYEGEVIINDPNVGQGPLRTMVRALLDAGWHAIGVQQDMGVTG